MWFLVWTGTGVAWGAIVSLPFLLTPLFIPFGVIYCALAGALGFFVGVFIGAFVLPPICCWRSWVNGAPFRAGDRVRILDGPYRDEVRIVYDVWNERGEVRLDFGPHAKEEFADVFSYLSICRERVPKEHAVDLPIKC